MKVSVEKQRNIFGLVAPSPGYCLSESPSQKEGKQASADHAETQNARLNESLHLKVQNKRSRGHPEDINLSY